MNSKKTVLFAAGAAMLLTGAAFAAEQTVTGTYFDLKYDDAAGWKYDAKRDFKDSAKATSLKMAIPQENDPKRSDATVEILVKQEDHHDFRRTLKGSEYNQKEYVAGAYRTIPVGGLNMLSDSDRRNQKYFARVEGAGLTVNIKAQNGTKRADVDRLLNGLTFKVSDSGKKDAPWYWEGTPYTSASHTADVGSVQVTSTFLPIEPCLPERPWGDGYQLAVRGDKAWMLVTGSNLYEYSFDGAKFVKTGEIELGDGTAFKPYFKSMSMTDDGTIWLSSSGMTPRRVKDGVVTQVKGPKQIVVSPDGTWGIEASSRNGKEMKKYEIAADGSVKTVNFPLAEVDYMSNAYVRIDEKNIFISGREKGARETVLFVYDHAGKLQKILREPKKLTMGSVFFAAETASGYMALPLQSSVMTWDKDGNALGSVDVRSLYDGKSGVNGNVGGYLLAPNTVLALVIRERADMSSDELLAFKLSGF